VPLSHGLAAGVACRARVVVAARAAVEFAVLAALCRVAAVLGAWVALVALQRRAPRFPEAFSECARLQPIGDLAAAERGRRSAVAGGGR
jgi:zinc transporter ZupT